MVRDVVVEAIGVEKDVVVSHVGLEEGGEEGGGGGGLFGNGGGFGPEADVGGGDGDMVGGCCLLGIFLGGHLES